MNIVPLALEGLLLLQARIHTDSRGFFMERYHRKNLEEFGIPTTFAQDNHSRSMPKVLRGLHYQANQGKFIGIVRGHIFDVCVDIRPSSPTFGKHIGVEISAENGNLLWVPPGFAHGFCVLGNEPADLWYKVSDFYDPKAEGGILWNDPALGIRWPIQEPLLSDRDRALPTLAQYRANLHKA